MTSPNQAASPTALVLFDLLADSSSALYSCLRVCDLFCVRLTCKEAWTRIYHKGLTDDCTRRHHRRDGRTPHSAPAVVLSAANHHAIPRRKLDRIHRKHAVD